MIGCFLELHATTHDPREKTHPVVLFRSSCDPPVTIRVSNEFKILILNIMNAVSNCPAYLVQNSFNGSKMVLARRLHKSGYYGHSVHDIWVLVSEIE